MLLKMYAALNIEYFGALSKSSILEFAKSNFPAKNAAGFSSWLYNEPFS